MMFSATTPVFTDRDEQEELQSLSAAELKTFDADAYGWHDTNDTGALSNDQKHARVRALQDCLQTSDNCCDLYASFQASSSARHETPLTALLATEDWDVPAAARRFQTYWSLRQEVFAENIAAAANAKIAANANMQCNAFAPIDTLLSDEDRHHLVHDRFVLPLERDAAGRTVFLWDRMRASAVPRDRAVRLLLYTMTQTLRDDGRRGDFQQHNDNNDDYENTAGYVIIMNYFGCSEMKYHYDRRLTKLVLAVGLGIPARLRCAHLYLGTSYKTFASLLMPVIRQLSPRHIRRRIRTHVGHSPQLEQAWAPYGLDAQHVRAVLTLEGRKPTRQWERLLSSDSAVNLPSSDQNDDDDVRT